MKDKSKILAYISCLFGGVILGFLLSPMKNGMNIKVGNNTGNQYFRKEDNLQPVKNVKE